MFAPTHYCDFLANVGGLRARMQCAIEDGTDYEAGLRDAYDRLCQITADFRKAQADHFAKHGLVSISDAARESAKAGE